MKGKTAVLGGMALACFMLNPALQPALAGQAQVYVEDSAPAGGDGSEQQPVRTIQEAISLLPKQGGTVLIHPGTYIGPILVDRDGVVLWGMAEPVYDADGFLAGFDEEVVVTTDRPLEGEDPETGQAEDLIELRGSNNEVHNVVADLAMVPMTPGSSAISAAAEDDDFYDNIVFRNIVVRGVVDLAGYSFKASVDFEYFTALDPGFAGLWIGPTANRRTEVSHAHVASKAANVVFAAMDEVPKEENGPSVLNGVLRNSKLEKANGFIGFFTEGTGLLVIGRKNAVNPEEPSTIILEVESNIFQDNRTGATIWPVHGPRGFSTEPTLIGLDFHDNTYRNHLVAVEVDFQTPPWAGSIYAANSAVRAHDGDGVFPDPADVDLGPPENGNSYTVVQD